MGAFIRQIMQQFICSASGHLKLLDSSVIANSHSNTHKEHSLMKVEDITSVSFIKHKYLNGNLTTYSFSKINSIKFTPRT